MTLSTCPHCHQAVSAGDDICENCGVVLSGQPSLLPTMGSTAIPVVAPPMANSMSVCPNCQQPVHPGDEICENCGVVLATFVKPTVSTHLPIVSHAECPQCHAPRVVGVKFCNHCGFRFETATSLAASSVISQPYLITTWGVSRKVDESKKTLLAC